VITEKETIKKFKKILSGLLQNDSNIDKDNADKDKTLNYNQNNIDKYFAY